RVPSGRCSGPPGPPERAIGCVDVSEAIPPRAVEVRNGSVRTPTQSGSNPDKKLYPTRRRRYRRHSPSRQTAQMYTLTGALANAFDAGWTSYGPERLGDHVGVR